MSQPPSYPGSGSGENDPTGDENLPPTHSAYGQQPSGGDQYGQPAYGQSQYGQQPYDPNNPYGAWQGGNDAGKGTDGLSIAAFVISLVCCPLGFIGAILGFIGLGRTKDGQRKGRWAAVSAIIIGIIGTLLGIGAGVAVWYTVKDQVTTDNAKVGQCIDVDNYDDDKVSLKKKGCSEDHDGQIFAVSKLSGSDAQEIDDNGGRATISVCGQKESNINGEGSEDGHVMLDDKRATFRWVTEDPKDPDAGDTVVCFFEVDSGKLNKSYVD